MTIDQSLTQDEITKRVREVVRNHARLAIDIESLTDDADLYQAGMTSHASVNLMLALEEAFDLEFPDSMLTRQVFESVASISRALREQSTMSAS